MQAEIEEVALQQKGNNNQIWKQWNIWINNDKYGPIPEGQKLCKDQLQIFQLYLASFLFKVHLAYLMFVGAACIRLLFRLIHLISYKANVNSAVRL